MDVLDIKLEKDEREARKNMNLGKIARVILWVVFVIALLLVFVAGTGILIGIVAFITFGASQAKYDKAKKQLALIHNFRLYSEKTYGMRMVKIDELSERVCQTPAVVLSNLKEMIQIGYIFKVEEGADYYRYAYIRDTAVQLPDAEERIEVTVTCEACGGVTKIPKGKSGVCSYCESKIKA